MRRISLCQRRRILLKCALPYFPGEALQVTFDRIPRNFRLCMRASHPSKGIPSGSRAVWWRHFMWKGPTRENIAQLPVAHARILPSVTSHPVAMLVIRNDAFYTTTIVRKKRGEKSWHAHAITSSHVTSGSGHVTSVSTSLHLLKCGFGCPYILLTSIKQFSAISWRDQAIFDQMTMMSGLY